MDFPKLHHEQHAVVTVEVSTGIVVNLDGQQFIGDGEPWRIFESLLAAREFAVAEVTAHPSFECGIYKSKNQPIQTIRNEAHLAHCMHENETRT